MLADHLLRLLPMIVSRCLIERGKECDPMIKICHLLLIWKKNKSLLVNVILVITYWHHEREKQRKWWTLFSWSSSSHRDSPSAICPLPGAQVTQAAFEDLRDIWRDTFDPGEISALGVILLIHGDNCCSSDDTFDLGAILGLERDTFDLGEIPIVAVNPSCEYLGADQLEFC